VTTKGPLDSRSPEIALSPRLYLKIAKVLNDYSRTRETRRSAAIRLFESCAPENKQVQDALEPIVSQWMETTEWFVKTVHDSGRADGDHNWAELTTHFLLFECTLTALVGQFFTTIEGLDEILEDTNS
jgi:hypothetical protein